MRLAHLSHVADVAVPLSPFDGCLSLSVMDMVPPMWISRTSPAVCDFAVLGIFVLARVRLGVRVWWDIMRH